eukprot:1347925-Pyramimonas_sp.AAC.1
MENGDPPPSLLARRGVIRACTTSTRRGHDPSQPNDWPALRRPQGGSVCSKRAQEGHMGNPNMVRRDQHP